MPTPMTPEYKAKLKAWNEAEAAWHHAIHYETQRDGAYCDALRAKADALWAELCALNGRLVGPEADQ